jgi:hypothetical protein
MTALARASSNYKISSSRQSGCYIMTMTASVQWNIKIAGRESKRACSQDELIGGKPPAIKYVSDSDPDSD